ncbi:hypothetical protein CcCBS67573_g03504 [Chytriomyces confervae]|uniref:C2H2-type domain-containing protein n=1 Tax=Chytriomyces confervae TaxID=246404 RepID=A0A507FG72_9FUNG|nr:hypothetical protein CcCBS67573_g03504 [Chytriomyces confervae]
MFALDLLASAALSSRGGSPVPSHEASPTLCPAATPLAEHLMDSGETAPSSGVGLGLSIGVTLPMPHKPHSLPPISSIHQSLPVARAPVLLSSSSAGPARQRLYSVTATTMFMPKQAPYVHLQQNPDHHQQQQQQQQQMQQQPGPRIVIGSSPSITPISETFPTSATTASAPTSPTMGSGAAAAAAAQTTFRPRSFSVRHVNLVPAPAAMSTGTLAYSTNSTAIPPQSVFLVSPVTNASAATSPATPTSFNQMHVQSNSSHPLVPQILKQKPLSAISAPTATADTPAAAARNDYSCPHCLKDFTRKHHLVSHMVSHSQAAPLKCPISGCDATFRRNQDRRRHIRKIRHDGADASVVAAALKSCNSMDA